MSRKTMAEKYPRTVPVELLNTWISLKRRGDGAEIAKALKLSRPVIDRAINYGHIKRLNDLPDLINKFFHDRMVKEKGAAKQLDDMAAKQ